MFFILSGLSSVLRLQRWIHSPLCSASILSGISSSGLASLVREVRPPSCLVSPKFGGPEPCERCELCESQNVTVGWWLVVAAGEISPAPPTDLPSGWCSWWVFIPITPKSYRLVVTIVPWLY